MRHQPSPAISLVLALGCAIGCAACRSGEPASTASDQPPPKLAEAPIPATPDPTPSDPPHDPDRADKLRDLDDMCKAVDHDYADGTLRNYYSGLELRTPWGTTLRELGDESTTPGRTLEQAAAELAVSPTDPGLEHCAKLFDYLDEVE
ncbi:hypothetical protein [Enhygromyxa salina]|uniref:Lipoprotein n=1 Tax=Enhygromyxa salina TaxID=215803 RepID=A0A2S9XNL2_9BACT|nr:hypothetical protein [Enhygromyxa salina]PRP94271.1 hypothetical protein ENSA7_78080 [Enhygromyxa salina]